MSQRTLRIETGSRLHFGLLSFGYPDEQAFADLQQYGGVGLMVDRPGMVVWSEPAQRFEFDAPGWDDRVMACALKWMGAVGRKLPACRLTVERAAPEHVGLGTGTQFALAVATLLFQASEMEVPDARGLARAAGRGLRSSIGTHGFLHGGLLVELGKRFGQELAPLDARVELPESWRVVQIRFNNRCGLSGSDEKTAFHQVPRVPREVTDRLIRLIDESLLPAARRASLDDFGESVYQYGRLAGLCFAEIQGGPFASPQLAEWVEAIRGRGVAGVGQSSWGPTLFAFVENQSEAEDLVAWFERDLGRGPDNESLAACCISRVANRGAVGLDS